METVETRTYKGKTITIHQDFDPLDPRKEYDHFGVMVCWHRRYDLGDKHDFPDPKDFLLYAQQNKCVCLPVYMYDHSGIGISTSNTQYPFDCPWDAGQLGFIYVTYAKIMAEYSITRLVKSRIEKVKKMLQNEIDEYNSYLSGDVYGYVIKDDEDDNGESCWGFYGFDYCMSQAVETVDAIIEYEKEQAALLKHDNQRCCVV